MISKEEILSKITPKHDVIFKKIFGSKGNEGILKSFLESVLDIKIALLTLDVETELLPDFGDGKVSRLDVITKLEDGTIVNIEIQTNMHEFSDKRELVYWSGYICNNLKEAISTKEQIKQYQFGYLMGKSMIF